MRSIDELCPETSDTQGNSSEVVPNEEFAKVLAKELGKALNQAPEEPTEPEEQEEPPLLYLQAQPSVHSYGYEIAPKVFARD